MKTTINAFDLVMLSLSLIAIVIVSCIFFYPADTQLRALLINLDSLICVVFISHFIVSAIRSKAPLIYLRHHWIDLLASIPMVEALRLLRFFHAIKLIRGIVEQRHLLKNLKHRRIESTLASILFTLLVIILLGSIGILLAEQDQANGQISSAGEALWWAIVTISTVGYGDFVPVSDAGRIIAGLMILTGVGFFGAVSGLMSALLMRGKTNKEVRIEQLLVEHQKEQRVLQQQLNEIQQQLNQLQQTKD
ncbi:potassium channel family protein [Agarivorans sp. 1_MG-2023]|uniref:potassium channel family protein n=1 Tax=Agarivorans sp. 1_MG-2023 TaxID=3062634 RepID=UPI0026E42A07|nr:potassium channel family protein [Agarivorans sp. 1_MG-2023]MDO6763731.1 ion channel [Agarivorans sp. 1_MG-2023]